MQNRVDYAHHTHELHIPHMFEYSAHMSYRRIFRSYMAIPNAKCVALVLAEVVNYHHDTNGVKLIHMRNETAY